MIRCVRIWTGKDGGSPFEEGRINLPKEEHGDGLIEAQLFDLLLSAELDRNLKKNFGIAFFVATIFFTLLSFGVIVFNSILKWGISDIAITGLIIESSLQFIGLLYIIARNLFPQTPSYNGPAPTAATGVRRRQQETTK